MACRSSFIRLSVLAALAVTLPSTSYAQTASRTLFGADTSGAGRQTTMKLDWSLFDDYSTDLLARSASGIDSNQAVKGHTAGAEARLTMKHDGRRIAFAAAASSTLSYYPALKDLITSSGQAAVDVSVRVGRSSYFRMGQTAGYSPFYQLEASSSILANGALDGIVADGAFAVSRLNTHHVGTAVGLTHPFGRRTIATADYGVQHVASREHGMTAQRLGGRLSREIARNISAHAGYTYRFGRAGAPTVATPSGAHDLDIGVDYGRALSFSRRTTFSFRTGSSIASLIDQRAFGLVGLAGLTHHIGRTWTTSLQYRRGLDYVDGFERPMFSDSVTGHVAGALGRRADVAALLTSSVASPAGDASNGFASWSGFARFRFALSRTLALYTQYSSHHVRLVGPGVDALALTNRSARQGIRAGVTARMNLLH